MDFLPIPEYQGLYEVSECGKVRSVDRTTTDKNGKVYTRKGSILKQTPHKTTSYLTVSLWKNNKGKTLYVHRLVAQVFVFNHHGKPMVNHIDSNRHNNHASNLEWVTAEENAQHALESGLDTSRMTENQAAECLFHVFSGSSFTDLAAQYEFHPHYVARKVREYAIDHQMEERLDEALNQQRKNRAANRRKDAGNCEEDRESSKTRQEDSRSKEDKFDRVFVSGTQTG